MDQTVTAVDSETQCSADGLHQGAGQNERDGHGRQQNRHHDGQP